MLQRALVALAISVIACSSPVPEANGYDVQLYFDVGTTLPVGKPEVVSVRRIEQRPEQCATNDGSCDPMAETPITLINASCDSLCTVTPASSNGVVTLEITAESSGNTTLHVSVRSDVDGSEWDDAYPLTFR
jgi:hypothetical protein